MKLLARLSIGLIAVGLALPLWSVLNLIFFVQPQRARIAAGQLHYMFSYENWIHEVGFARLTISIIGLLILFIPYRRGERWAFLALGILAVAYYVPVYIYGAIPNSGTWPLLQHLNLPQGTVSSLWWVHWSSIFFTALLLLGLAMSAFNFFRKTSH